MARTKYVAFYDVELTSPGAAQTDDQFVVFNLVKLTIPTDDSEKFCIEPAGKDEHLQNVPIHYIGI